MRKLPSEDELRDTADEVSKQLQTLSVHDFDKLLAVLDVQVWETERQALVNLTTGQGEYYAGWLNGLAKFREGLVLAKAAKARAS